MRRRVGKPEESGIRSQPRIDAHGRFTRERHAKLFYEVKNDFGRRRPRVIHVGVCGHAAVRAMMIDVEDRLHIRDVRHAADAVRSSIEDDQEIRVNSLLSLCRFPNNIISRNTLKMAGISSSSRTTASFPMPRRTCISPSEDPMASPSGFSWAVMTIRRARVSISAVSLNVSFISIVFL